MKKRESLLKILNLLDDKKTCGCPVCDKATEDAAEIAIAEGIHFFSEMLQFEYGLGLMLVELPEPAEDDGIKSHCDNQTLGDYREKLHDEGIDRLTIDLQRRFSHYDVDAYCECCDTLDIEELSYCETLEGYPFCQLLRAMYVAGITEFTLDSGAEGEEKA